MTSSYKKDNQPTYEQFIHQCAVYNFQRMALRREKFTDLAEIGLTLNDFISIAYDMDYGYTLDELLPFYIYEGKRINQVIDTHH